MKPDHFTRANLRDRQIACYKAMRRAGKHLYDGKVYESSADTDISRHWKPERRRQYQSYAHPSPAK